MDPLIPRDAVVTSRQIEPGQMFTLRLGMCDGSPLLYKPGQYNMLGLPGIGEAPLTFSSWGTDGEFAHTIRPAGRVTKALERLTQGQLCHVRGPFGSCWPLEEARGKNIIIIAGGTGIIPLRGFIGEVLSNRSLAGRVTILYGSRSPQDMLFRSEAQEWGNAENTSVRLTVDEANDQPDWTGAVGVVTDLLEHPSRGIEAQLALVCGPEMMMRFAVRELLLRGMRPGQIYLSLERNMRCGVGHCGHCQLGPKYVCQDGPVLPYSQLRTLPDTLL